MVNLFVMAEFQLQKEKRAGVIKKYTIDDIIDKAIYIRRWLDRQARNIKVARSRYKKH